MNETKCSGKCISKINEQLKPKGVRIKAVLTMSDDLSAMYADVPITLERIGGGRLRKSDPTLVAAFCPFCGGKMERQASEAA